MAVFRAVETRTPLARCANTGISMIVDPYGRITHETETFVEAMIDVQVLPSDRSTFYVRHGEWLPRLLAACLGAMILAAILVTLGSKVADV
jgi:apolipoprotein N-acyltransferase